MKKLTAIFDIGKTNKKLLLFDSDYNVVHEISDRIPETTDDDGFPCEDLPLLGKWLEEKWTEISSNAAFNITAVNFAAYGASWVHLDKQDQVVTPLYSYLKPYPLPLAEHLYEQYEGRWNFSVATSSPPMGMLNSGLQLLWLKHKKLHLFQQITSSLHLPQYLSFLFSGIKVSDYTSIGCHTALWDFSKSNYHQWVLDEKLDQVLAPLSSKQVSGEVVNNKKILVGPGLHDSSSAMIPYLKKIKEPFLLVSTGTWCITLNPFNSTPLNKEELSKDCLCYLTPEGKPIKASRIFSGREHEYQTERIATHFGKDKNFYKEIKFDLHKIEKLLNNSASKKLVAACMEGTGPFPAKPNGVWDLQGFASCEEAYLQLLLDLSCLLAYSMQLVDKKEVKTIFVEGGFAANETFMNLIANHFPNKEVKASFLHQATALGAAMQMNKSNTLKNWNFKEYKTGSISSGLEKYGRNLLEQLVK